MLLGTSTREVELITFKIGDVNGNFAMPEEVMKVDKGELLFLDNPNYEETIANNPHLIKIRRVIHWVSLLLSQQNSAGSSGHQAKNL